MRPSSALAVAAYLLVVPGSVALAYLGHDAGLYPFVAVPVALGATLVVALGLLFVALPRVRAHLD